jgi:hypothetical protein
MLRSEALSRFSSFYNFTSSLVRCIFVWGCERAPLIVSRGFKKSSLEISGTKYLVTQRHITEELIPHSHH